MDDKNIPLLQDAAIKDRVNKVWEEVFASSNVAIVHAKRYGFIGMEIIPNPNIHQIMVSIRILDEMIDTFINENGLEYDEKRKMLNAKRQLTTMELVAVALREGRREDFDSAMNELETQACF
jgi:pyruvate formate-lyase activating enzyme-like uncharacterized protein